MYRPVGELSVPILCQNAMPGAIMTATDNWHTFCIFTVRGMTFSIFYIRELFFIINFAF